MSFALICPHFRHGDTIPQRYTCQGTDVSPPLQWGNVPGKTVSFVLIVGDPDAPKGTFIHWMLYDLPAVVRRLPEGLPAIEMLPQLGKARQGKNDFGRIGYSGPCPPAGSPHRYYFQLHAVDRMIGLPSGATLADVRKAVQGHVVGEAELMGTYGRR